MTLARTIRQCCDERGVRFADAVAACERALVAAAEHVYGDALRRASRGYRLALKYGMIRER